MRRNLLLALALAAGALLSTAAWSTSQLILTSTAALNTMRPCSYQDATPQNLSISGTSAATATKLSGGKVIRIICSSAVYYRQSASAAPTAVGTDQLVPANTPEWFYTDPAGSYVAAIQDSASGTCNLTTCR